jgi:hypothetical protein
MARPAHISALMVEGFWIIVRTKKLIYEDRTGAMKVTNCKV